MTESSVRLPSLRLHLANAMGLTLNAPLAPLLWAQGVHTRRKTVVLPEPPGPRSGRTGSGSMLRLLIAGDSAAAGVGVDHQDQRPGRRSRHRRRFSSWQG